MDVNGSAEFAAITAIAAGLPGPPDSSQTWIGDDAAVLPAPAGGHLLFAADTVVEGVHADLSLTSIADLGWKALAAAVSDVAAMGGEPGHAVVTVACPARTDLVGLYQGLAGSARLHHCPIVGGDLVSAPALVVTVAVTGWCAGEPVLRSGARAGDLVWVSRSLGASAAGLRMLRAGVAEGPCLDAHARPVAELSAGRAARLAGATAMIDVSDGLAADLGHIADASGVGVDLSSVPVAPGATLEEALGGGEDFALVACAPQDVSVPGAHQIGVCTADAGVLRLGGDVLARSGWEHRL